MSTSSSGFANNPMLAALTEEQRKAMTSAFEAMSNWRQEMTSMQEKNSAVVFQKMSDAAKAAGWPAEFVDMTQKQMQSATKMQSQALEQVMGVWEKQATQPAGKFEMPSFPGMPGFGSMPGFGAMPSFPGMPAFPSFPGMPGAGTFPGMPDMTAMGSMPMMPVQFWMQAAEMWQKSWQQAVTSMMDAQKSMTTPANGASKPGAGR
jgi:hypothetical protein